MNAVILGGTFDPVHIGHLHLADIVSHRYRIPRIIFVPSWQPPHKEKSPAASAEHRLAMLRLALEGTGWEIDTLEMDRGRVGYTIDTVREMRRLRGWTEPPGFVLGDDLVEGFSRWKEPEALAEEARLILACRDHRQPPAFDYPHENLGNSVLTVSSTEIREALRKGTAVRYLLTEPVYGYIREKGLYGYRTQD